MSEECAWIEPDWPAPGTVRALSTTRCGGVSRAPFASLNLGDHVGDESAHVAHNRALLIERAGLPEAPRWLDQVHGHTATHARHWRAGCTGDALIAERAGQVCAVLTADCLPLLLCDVSGTRVGAVHAGWRGLAGGIIEHAIGALDVAPHDVLVWLGPAIGPAAFEVGDEVRDTFLSQDAAAAGAFERRGARWHADLFLLARQRLERLGVTRIYGGGECTFSRPERFFSYRRDGQTGRMASLIWRQS